MFETLDWEIKLKNDDIEYEPKYENEMLLNFWCLKLHDMELSFIIYEL